MVGEILRQLYSGMRGMPSMITETSKLDPHDGIKFRGYSLDELLELLPKSNKGEQALPEGIFYLMLIGELPTQEDVSMISKEWMKRSKVPDYVFKTIDSFPNESHPMTQFSAAILALRNQSFFRKHIMMG